jgi:hypothetical protein
MTFGEKLLYHHNHPAKLAIDVICLVVAGMLIWQQHLLRAIAVGIGGPLIASAIVLAFAGVSAHRTLTWPVVAMRVAGALMFWLAAWYRSILYCIVGVLIIAAPWIKTRSRR